MKRLNNKGFTLVELIAVMLLLSLVMGIGGYSVTRVINSSREKDYDLLIGNIKNAAEDYYIECKYGKASDSSLVCDETSGSYLITLGDLVDYGFLTGNKKDENDKYTLVNPINDKNIYNCNIKINYSNGDVLVIKNDTNGNCPLSY